MELLYKFKENGYFTSELYHLLSKKRMGNILEEIIPSQYIKEMSLSPTERLNSLKDIHIENIISIGHRKEKALTFSPRILVFQNFKPNDTITAKFSVLNASKAPTFINMAFKESSFFSLKPCGGKFLSRLAPGISVTFIVTFTPSLYADYTHRVAFYTEKDEYIVPLIGMGPRPVFDFPDEIIVPKTPLKIEQTHTITVRNIGPGPASVSLLTRCPFYVQPKSIYLKPNEQTNIKISCRTLHVGETEGTLYAALETGEHFRINLSCTTYSVNVELEKQVVRFPDTYNSMVRQVTFKVYNKSHNILSYFCMKNESIKHDFEEKVKMATIYYKLRESESEKYAKLHEYDVLRSSEHERIYTRIFYDEIQALAADESFFYNDPHFAITPVKGQLWPYKATDITVVFSPKDIGEFDSIAFLDIDGVCGRVPLKLVGTALPPAIQLNIETLDMDCVYINKIYNYEVIAINRGHIDGVIVYKEMPALFGSIISCSPEKCCLAPGEQKIFIITFLNSNQGPYFEEVNFLINDSNVVLKLYLKGEIIYPSISFSIPCLDFGMVSLGVPKTLEFDVINESVVEVIGSVKISSDGPEISSITLNDYAVTDRPKPTIPEWPREFDIQPSRIEMEPESRISLKVTLTANLVRANQTAIELEFDKSDSPPIVLPVTFNATVPEISPSPEIKLRACFVDYDYKYDLVLSSNEFYGYFTVEDPEEENTLICEIGIKEGEILPNSTLTLPVIIKTHVFGQQELDVRLHLFGLSKSIIICHVSVFGVRPIVTCAPMSLHWGQVKLLTRTQKILTICNDSPVYVNFKASLLNRDGKWQIDPWEGALLPESETDLTAHLYLVDAATYQNKIIIHLEKVKDIMIPISATGVGTSIVVGNSQELILVGRHFTKLPFSITVDMENKGTRLHSLEWCEFIKPPKTKQISQTFYKLDPRVLKLCAEEIVELTINGVANKAANIKETWYLFGNVEGINKKELLLEIDIIAEFVDPRIEVTPNILNLQYDYGPYNEFYKLTDIVTIKNVSKLPLDMDISLKTPFAIIQKATTYKILPEEENLCCCICYDESDINVSTIESEMGPIQSKIFIDYLTQKPVEPLRDSPLNFFQDINRLKIAFNLTHNIEETLEDQDIMKIQILLDTTKHTTLKSRVYLDSLKIRFKGHKNRDNIKLIGKINFPNLFIIYPRLDFQCLLNGNMESKTIKVQNVTPLIVCYKFTWKKCVISSAIMPDDITLGSEYSSSTINTPTAVEEEEDMLQSRLPSDSGPDRVATEVKPIISGIGEMLEVSIEEENESVILMNRVLRKTIPMVDMEYHEDFNWKSKFIGREPNSEFLMNHLFQLIPHRGILKPNEMQHIQVIFKPTYDVNVTATLECEILGGPPETNIVTGQSADLRYALNTKKLKFKIRTFHEDASEMLRITNTSLLPFEYKTYLNEPTIIKHMEGTIITIDPPQKLLDSEEIIDVKVVVRPGIIGFYKRQFLLEISHLPHIPIEVMGWGVFPQIHLSLERPDIAKLPILIGYEAIQYMSVEYMQVITGMFNKYENRTHQSFTIVDKYLKDPIFQAEWHICSILDDYPEVLDIELAIERLLVINHVKKRPEMLEVICSNNTNKAYQTIHGFSTMPYVIDFGVIITGNTAQCIINVTNYGPIVAKPYLVKGTAIPPWLSLKICGKLQPGEIGKMEVGFSPTSEDFPELEEIVETSFNLEIPYGVTMPVQIKAICAVPFLVSNVASIDFGSVKCGDKVVISIPIKNVGKTTCLWWVTLRLKTTGPPPIIVLDTSGKYEHNEGGWLKISFKPVMEMLYEGLIIFKFHMNPNRMTIPIKGQGLCPHVHIIGPNVAFPPTLPYSDTTNLYFGITNPCSFPTELIIAHSDKKWKEEEEIYAALHKYYNKQVEMLVPAIKPGSSYPFEIVDFYNTLRNRVNKCKDDELKAYQYQTSHAKSAGATAKKGKSPKSAQSAINKEVVITKLRTEAEIQTDEMTKMRESGIDPLKDCLDVFDKGIDDNNDDRTRGIIIFVHASPCEEMQFQEVAYSIGKKLAIPVINLDVCIAQALCTCTCQAKEGMMVVIDELYEQYLISLPITEPVKQINKLNAEEIGESEEEQNQEPEDEIEVMIKKLDIILNNRNVGASKSKQKDAKPKKKSPTSSTNSQSAFPTDTIFEVDMLSELLTEYFSDERFSKGFIVDTLASAVLRSPPFALTLVLKCKRSIVNIHLVLCHSEFSKWAIAYEESLKEPEVLEIPPRIFDEDEIDEIISRFDDMDENEFENADPAEKAVYVRHGLEERRRRYREKRLGADYSSTMNLKNRSMKSLTAMDVSDSKRKLKKEDTNAAKKVDPKTAKPTPEYLLMNTRYNDYIKNTYENLVNIANNWIIDDCEMGVPLLTFSGQVVGAGQKKSKKKSEIQVQLTDVESEVERGFPFTIITCPCLEYKQALVNMLAYSPLVQNALREKKEINVLECPIDRKEFTVLLPKVFPTIHHIPCLQWKYLDEDLIKKCECNQLLTDLNFLDDSTQDNVLQILSKWHCVCGKKLTSSQTSTSIIPSTSIEKGSDDSSESSCRIPLHSVKSVTEQSSRLTLQPGDLARCKYSFNPTREGVYSVKRYVEVKGWPDSTVVVTVSGICDIPRLDSRPKKMFDNFVRRKTDDVLYQLTYLDDVKLFEFGPIFIGSNRVYEEEYYVNLKNSSLITANVVIEFLEDTNVFEFDQDYIPLEPGCKGKLKITAAPTEIGVYTNVLLFSVKDNPEIVEVELSCSGVVPIIEIMPLMKFIDYGKLLLYRREDDRIIVKNDSILPIMWQIRNAEDFAENFIISRKSGVVPAGENQVVPIIYIACEVGVIMHKVLIVDIYDCKGRGDPMVVDMLYLSAECYDVKVECTYENPNESYLNYGNVKVNSTVSQELYLYNRGKYNIYFKLKKVKNFPQPSLLNSMEVSQEYGLVPPIIKTVSVQFTCSPTTSMNLVNVPVYMCYLLDGNIDQVIVAKFPICITIASFYNTFTLFPLGELNFHIIPVGSGVIREVIINNTSKCPVTYEIQVPEKYKVDPNAPPEKPEKSKGKDNKIKVPPLKCGNFMIYIEDNLLEPGSSRTLQIHFLATAACTFEETIDFIISDTCPAEANGVPLKLVGTGAMPILDLWNLETTFREHLIVKKISDYKVPESSPHCVFVEDTVTLNFFCVTINSRYTAAIDLYNNGLVPSVLTMVMHYQSNCNNDIFFLDKYETTVEPLLHKNIGIIFAPKALEEYRAVLEIKLKLLDNQQQSYKICLIGEGVIPRIELITPHLKQPKIGSVHFPVTCLGSTSQRFITFKNIVSCKCTVLVNIVQQPHEEKLVFSLAIDDSCSHMLIRNDLDNPSVSAKVIVNPGVICKFNVFFDPIKKKRAHCDVKIIIENNPYEYFTLMCEAEAFMEDIILHGLELLPLDGDILSGMSSTGSTLRSDGKKKAKSAPADSKQKKKSIGSVKQSAVDIVSLEPAVLRYLLDFGGCELCSLQRRTIIMINNSEKVYKFAWQEMESFVIKPSVGYISPGEEQDFELIFFSTQPTTLKKEPFQCSLYAINTDTYTTDDKGNVWTNNQTITVFTEDREEGFKERYEGIVEEQNGQLESSTVTNTIFILLSIATEYIKYKCDLNEEIRLEDTFIYKKRKFDFKLENIGIVPMKISWTFTFDDEFPSRLDKVSLPDIEEAVQLSQTENKENSQVTLYSGKSERDSVDTWFEIDLPFTITPQRVYLKPNERQVFKVEFAPYDAFNYRVRLKSSIDNLNPYDQNVSLCIFAKALIPYCHLDIEDSDYIKSGRRKPTEIALPENLTILEFNVVGSGCYEKVFKLINPTDEAYEFLFEMVLTDRPELIPVHCDTLKGFIEGGTSTDIKFTFTPTAPGVTESLWNFLIPIHSLVINLMVVGIVRESDVVFVPTILMMKNSLVGFTIYETVTLKNSENESLQFEFKGNSLCNESGKTPMIVEPNSGVLKPRSEMPIRLIYTPIVDGPLSFKIFCCIQYMTKYLTLCVNALSHLIKPYLSYYIIGHEHVVNSEAVTNIHLDQTASTYERTIKFLLKNDGSASFLFEWHYSSTSIKKYMNVEVEPRTGHVVPGEVVTCILSFTLKVVPVKDYPVSLTISNGPEYRMYLHAEIEKPLYHFSFMEYDFGRCIVNTPDFTYTRNLAFVNDDKRPLIAQFLKSHYLNKVNIVIQRWVHLEQLNVTELFVHYHEEKYVEQNKRMKIKIYFRPKESKEYEFKLRFWVNSLCEEIVIIRGEGIPLLIDLYEGCQKSYDLGVVRVGEKIIKEIEVMNHSKVMIDAKFIFRDMYGVCDDDGTKSEATSICLSPSVQALTPPDVLSRGKMLQQYEDQKVKERISQDVQNALSSLKVTPNTANIGSHRKVPLKIQFKPVGIISELDVQLNIKVFEFVRPLVRLRGIATGMSLSFSQNSLQFGRVRKHGRKILKVMLLNKGDFDTRFWWQPLTAPEFSIAPMQGMIAAHTNVTFTVTFRPINHNPFIKGWASCNLENYKPLELAMYGTCVDIGNIQNQSMYFECPVRQVQTEYITIVNPTDEVWLVASEVNGSAFETLKDFRVEPSCTFNIPLSFKPKTIGKHEAKVLISPLGESALFVTVIGLSIHPLPNDTIRLSISAKETITHNLLVYNLTEFPESYVVNTEVVKMVPDKFAGFYEIKHPDIIKVWGEASATCRWTYACYEVCEMHTKVTFVNEETNEYQYYIIEIVVNPGEIVDVISLTSRARETVQYSLKIRNPLSTDAEFQTMSENISCPCEIKVTAQSESKLVMTFSPLVVGMTEELLTVTNPLVGTVFYKMILKCLPAKEKNLEYTTSFGKMIPIRLRVENRSDVKTDFICAVSHDSIVTEKEYQLEPYKKGKFLVWFEPIQLGVQSCTVTFNSAMAGEFVFNIKGIATPPKPRGPVEIKVGGTSIVKFKNIFNDVKIYKIYCDKEEFTVKTVYETLKPKKDCKIIVALNELLLQQKGLLPTGTLTVEDVSNPTTMWTYFLQGIP